MNGRRQFLKRSLAVVLAAVAEKGQAQTSSPYRVYMPRVQQGLVDDAPLLGPASGTVQQAVKWFTPRAKTFTADEVAGIVADFQRIGEPVGLDWFLAMAQMGIETGSLTSWWAQTPQRNPAGIAVTGRMQAGTADNPPGTGWTWDGSQWQEGWSFLTWSNDAVPAHLGRLLAYALRDEQANTLQLQLINKALGYRPLTKNYRGIAPTIRGLNGRWAVPGTEYGQNIMALARRMRSV